VGVPAPFWFTPLFLRFFPPALPETVEPLIMGMPFVFDAEAARDADVRIQFCVTGSDAGDYYLRIANGKCESLEGRTRTPDLTVYTPDTVWVEMVHGQLDRARALEQGLYRVEGDLTILARMASWFPPQATRRTAATMGHRVPLPSAGWIPTAASSRSYGSRISTCTRRLPKRCASAPSGMKMSILRPFTPGPVSVTV